MLVLQIALLVLAVALAYLVLTPRFQLPLLTEVNLGIASVSAMVMALASIERSLGYHHHHNDMGLAFVVLVISSTFAIIGLVRRR